MLRALDLKTFEGKPRISPTDFEKDDDSNHHIDWITSGNSLIIILVILLSVIMHSNTGESS